MNSASTTTTAEAQRSLAVAAALLREGLVPESRAAIMQALKLTLDAWRGTAPAASAETDAVVQLEADDRAFAALALAKYGHLGRLRDALAAGAKANQTSSAPAGQSPPDLEWIWDEVEGVMRFTARHFRSESERKRARRRAIVGAAAIAVFVLVCAVRVWLLPHVSASATYSPEFGATAAFDGLEATEWLLPDGAAGWVQIRFAFKKRIRSVRIYNAHNKHWLDRAAEQVRVTALSNGQIVNTVEGRFDGVTAERKPLDLPLDARGVTHLRIDILSHFAAGGGLGEVEIL